jgi:trk system potassium uptake protein TrkA
LDLAECDAVFISLGENQNMTPSILSALHCRELGARRVIVKGLSEDHGKILRNLGVERVVFPEIEIATELADRMTWPNVLDFMPIDPEYSFVEMAIPESLVGKTLRETDLRRLYNVWVIGVKDAMTGRLELLPEAEYRLGADQLLVVVAKQDAINRLREVK